MTKLFFFDIDGTIAHGQHIPNENIAALKKLRELGHYTFICTGRPISYAKMLFGSLVDGYITSNGRQAYFHDEQILDKPLTHEEVKRFMSICQSVDCDYAFIGSQKGYISDVSEELFKKLNGQYKREDFFERVWDPEKITTYIFDIFYKDDDHFKHIVKAFEKDVILNDHHGAFSADATTISHDKGDGIASVLKYLKMEEADSFAFGDGSNDLCMFKSVKNKIATGNAIDTLKKEATYISSDYLDGGIVNALKHFNLL